MLDFRFYYIKDDYLKYLHDAEKAVRGISKVPFINKGIQGNTQKFYCGIVLDINGISYFAPISSYNKYEPRNFMFFDNHQKIIASIRFNYMIPAPPEALTKMDFSNIKIPTYKDIVVSEWKSCIKSIPIIINKAYIAYTNVLKNHTDPQNSIVKNSCDFPLLERKCIEYCIEHNYEIPHRCDYPNLKGNCFFVKCTAQQKEAIAEILTQTTSDITKTDAGYTIAIHNCHKTKVVEICKKHKLPIQQKKTGIKKEFPKQPSRSMEQTATVQKQSLVKAKSH